MKKILVGIGIAVAVLMIVVVTRPDTYHVERSVSVAAPASAIYAQVSDFRAWAAWSPWEQLDPGMKKSFAGNAGEVGSTYSWVGNDQVGTGKMTITEAVSNQKVVQRLEFAEPFESKAMSSLVLVPEGRAVKVTWAMDGENDVMGKAFGLFIDMDDMIGADYEKGLARLKQLAEARVDGPEGDEGGVIDAPGAAPTDSPAPAAVE